MSWKGGWVVGRRRSLGKVVGAAIAAAVLCLPIVQGTAAAQVSATEYQGSTALGLALRQLGTTKRVLMIAAHPDDEATQLLSTLALGEGAEVAYLSLTRGEGGQNGIGGELQEGLGLLRSEELLAARRLDGASQYFTRAIDYGFSKDAEEAFRQWPREDLLRDVVAVVRHFRPTVIVSVFSGTPRDGHGQHQAAGIIARDAFAAAADPSAFPDQATHGLRPHETAHLFQLIRGPEEAVAVELATGSLDPLLGRSHFQVAMASRSRHRSQDMGRILTPGPQSTPLTLLASRSARPADGLFAGTDTTLAAAAASAYPGGGPAEPWRMDLSRVLRRYEVVLDSARAAFNPLRADAVLDGLATAARLLDEAHGLVDARRGAAPNLEFLLSAERRRLGIATARSASIEVDAIVDDETLVPGQTFTLEARVWNGGGAEIDLRDLEPVVPTGWRVEPVGDRPRSIGAGQLISRRFRVTVPLEAEPTEPYFLRSPRRGAMYEWPEEVQGVGVPFQPEPIRVSAGLTVSGIDVDLSANASFQGLDSRSGEFRRPVRVVPAVSLTTRPTLMVVPIARAGEMLRVSVAVLAEQPEGIRGDLRLRLPDGWAAEPSSVPLAFTEPGQARTVDFVVRPSAALREGSASIEAVFTDSSGRRFDRGYALVDYPHVRPHPLYRSSEIPVQLVDVRIRSTMRVGYVAAAGDNVPGALAQLGITVEPLDEDALAAAPLGAFDAIVVGSRAYEGRPDLIAHNQRLLDYVRGGGTMIVQYNQYEYTQPGIAPYPVTMARPHDRVTDEFATVTLLEPQHPVLSSPNRISDLDFAGWVQERGLYFLNTWDDRYTPLLEMADPGEEPKRGSLLVAEYGDGVYVYTGLAFFRQLAAGVPGAYRLFANLLSLGTDPQ